MTVQTEGSLAVAWAKGGDALLHAIGGERAPWSARLSSSVASAPGSRISGTIAGGYRLRFKVHRCVKCGERFDIEGRFIDLRRDVRDLIVERLASS